MDTCLYNFVNKSTFCIFAFSMERSREILTLSVFGLAASFGAIVLWKSLKRPSVSESPRGLSIQRASVRTSATRTIAFDDADSQTVVEEAPTILNALYMYSQDSAKQGDNKNLIW